MYPPKKLKSTVKLIVLNIESNYSFKGFFKLFKLINNENISTVHVHSSLLMFYLFPISCFFKRVSFFQTIHSTVTPGYKKLFKFLNSFRFLNRSIIHVCISKGILKNYKSQYRNLKFAQINNGILPLSVTNDFEKTKKEILQLKKTPFTKVFVAIGNYSNFKNFAMLAEVFSFIQKSGHDVILLIIGADPSPGKSNFNSVKNIKAENTYQLGSKQNIADYLFCVDALVISSTHEGMPLVALEALSAGVPIISTPAGGMVDIVRNGENGYITETFDKQCLTKQIEKFLELDEEHVLKLKMRAKEDFDKYFTIQKCANEYIKLYES